MAGQDGRVGEIKEVGGQKAILAEVVVRNAIVVVGGIRLGMSMRGAILSQREVILDEEIIFHVPL